MSNTSPHRILQILNDVGRGMFSNGPPEHQLQEILAAAMTLLPAAVCSLWRRDASQKLNSFRLEALRGNNGRPPFPPTLNFAGSIGQRVLETRRCRAVPDLGAEPLSVERALAAQRDLVALLCAPAAGVDSSVPDGLLMCFTEVRHDFTALEILVAEALARQAGLLWHVAGMQRTTRRLEEELQTRKRVDRAKEILMDRRGMSAEDAFRWIQKRSMDTRRSMRDVAETIIISGETGRYTSIPHALEFNPNPTRR